MNFALDDPDSLRGLDEAAWAPDRFLTRRFITWCENALAAFYATRRCADLTTIGEPNTPAEVVEKKTTSGINSPAEIVQKKTMSGINSPAPLRTEAEVATEPPEATTPLPDPLQTDYDNWVTSNPTIPTVAADEDWAARRGITQARVARLRAGNSNPKLHQRGRRRK
jgi:hypothetical protein